MRTFGIEMELANVNEDTVVAALTAIGVACVDAGYTHRVMSSWKVVSDGSIRPFGCELVSPVLPATQESFDLIARVCLALQRCGAKVNKTCGLHVHIGGDDINLKTVKNVVKHYCKLEDVFDSVVAPSRRTEAGNGYCKSNIKTITGITMLANAAIEFKRTIVGIAFEKIDRCKSLDAIRELLGKDRYHKLNIEPIWRQGTIEFRQHQGSIESEKIVAWVRLLIGTVDWAAKARTVKLRRNESFSYLLWAAAGGHVKTGMVPTATKRFLTSRVRYFKRQQQREVAAA